jgi:CBS domain-containing protein
MRADEFMSKPVVTCQSNESLEQAARKMWDHDCGAIPIVNDEGTLVGILTDRDICMSAMMQSGSLGDLPIHTALANKAVFAVTPEVGIEQVRELMSSQQIRRIPVVDTEHKPVGIISTNDLVRAAVRSGEGMGKVMRTLSTICGRHMGIDKAA